MTENVSSLRSVKVATPPCTAYAVIPCGLAVRRDGFENRPPPASFEKLLWRELLSLKENGVTILLASHFKDDIAYLCDEVYQMDAGIISKVE